MDKVKLQPTLQKTWPISMHLFREFIKMVTIAYNFVRYAVGVKYTSNLF